MKRLIAIFITLGLIVGLMQGFEVDALAGYVKAYQISVDDVVNPVIEDITGEDSNEIVTKVEVSANTVKAASNSFSDDIKVMEYIRDCMVDRKNVIEFTYTGSNKDAVVANFEMYLKYFINGAMNEELATGNYQGDYIAWTYHGYSAGLSYSYNSMTGQVFQVTMSIEMEYNTTAEQESVVRQFVEDSCTRSDLYGDTHTNLEKVKVIHDLVCSTITYDYDAADADVSRFDEFKTSYTAYGAIANGTAVCQGYALLTYALCREVGIPVRFIASSGHGWNIVSIDNGKTYYNLDTTWDDTGDRGLHTYYLKSDADVQKGNTAHYRIDEYNTEAFRTAYPVPEQSYIRYESYADGHLGYDPYDSSLLVTYTAHSFDGDTCSICGYERTTSYETTIYTTEEITTATTTTVVPTTEEPTTGESTTIDHNYLATPVGFEYTGNEELPFHFAWQYVEGAEGYKVYINGVEYAIVTELCIDIEPEAFNYIGTYLIEVTAIAGDRESERASLDFYLDVLPTTTQAPTTEELTTAAPTTEEPTTEKITVAPTTEEPTTEESTTVDPTTEEKTTATPTTEEPTTEEPTTVAPTTEEQTTITPTTVETTTVIPTTEEPTTVAPTKIETTTVPTTTEEETTEDDFDEGDGEWTDSDLSEDDVWDDDDWDDEEVETPKKPSIKTVKRKSPKKISLKISKIENARGYQIQVSKKKKFKKVLYKKFTKKTKLTITSAKFKKQKTLYIRTRSYNLDDDDTKVFSKWTKAVKVKK